MLAVTAWLLSACGGNSSEQPSHLGAFASYSWTGAVSSVHAAWRVPEIKEGSPCGIAATWIGANDEGQGFIQIGTIEQCLKPTQRSLGIPLEANYYTFWSDTARGDHPRTLYEVRAGDLVEATLDLSHGRWRLTLIDATTAMKASFTSTEETQRRPYKVDWVQEDVLLPDVYAPYPRLSEVKLGHVLVNGKVPGIEQLEATAMSLGKETLAPTPLQSDAFAVQPDE
jgi:hypothetical protein